MKFYSTIIASTLFSSLASGNVAPLQQGSPKKYLRGLVEEQPAIEFVDHPPTDLITDPTELVTYTPTELVEQPSTELIPHSSIVADLAVQYLRENFVTELPENFEYDETTDHVDGIAMVPTTDLLTLDTAIEAETAAESIIEEMGRQNPDESSLIVASFKMLDYCDSLAGEENPVESCDVAVMDFAINLFSLIVQVAGAPDHVTRTAAKKMLKKVGIRTFKSRFMGIATKYFYHGASTLDISGGIIEIMGGIADILSPENFLDAILCELDGWEYAVVLVQLTAYAALIYTGVGAIPTVAIRVAVAATYIGPVLQAADGIGDSCEF